MTLTIIKTTKAFSVYSVFLLLAETFPFHSKAQQVVDKSRDSVVIMKKVKTIINNCNKQQLRSFQNFKKEIDSSHYFVAIVIDKANVIGGFQVAHGGHGAKQEERIQFSFLNEKLARVLTMHFKPGFISRNAGGAVYFFDEDKLIYKSENTDNLPATDSLVPLSYHYLQLAKKLVNESQ